MPIAPAPELGRPYHGELPPLAHFQEPGRFIETTAPDGRLLALHEQDGTLYWRDEAAILEHFFIDHALAFRQECDNARRTEEEMLKHIEECAQRTTAALRQMLGADISPADSKAIETIEAGAVVAAGVLRNR